MCVNAPEYLEAFFAAQKLGCVPVNVNYRYVGAELAYLLDNSDAVALVFHDEFAPTVADALAALAAERRPRVAAPGRARGRRRARSPARATTTTTVDARRRRGTRRPTREPSGDDLIFLYTGGTTGYPKAVMWRSDDLYVSLWQMARPGHRAARRRRPSITRRQAGRDAAARVPADARHRPVHRAVDARRAAGRSCCSTRRASTPTRCGTRSNASTSQVCTIVGDAFARPLLAALDAEPHRWDLSALRAITSSGVTWSPETKRGLLAHLPDVTLIDSLGASEGS